MRPENLIQASFVAHVLRGACDEKTPDIGQEGREYKNKRRNTCNCFQPPDHWNNCSVVFVFYSKGKITMYRLGAVCLLCILFCIPVYAVECNSGEYANGKFCVTCPTAYPYSVPNATSIKGCYLITQPGEYVDAAGAVPIKCPANHYCPGNLPVFYDMESRYVNVEYIRSTGTQYIDTGIILGSDIDTEIVFEVTDTIADNVVLFGAANNGVYYNLNAWANDIYIRYDDYAPEYVYWGHITPNEKSILEIKSGDWIFNGKSIYTNSGDFNIGLNGYLFAENQSGNAIWPHPSLKIFSFKQWRNGDLVLDLTPVYDLETGQYGMWDNVGWRFLANIGTGEFLGGEYLTGFNINGIMDCATATGGDAPYSPIASDDIMDCGHILHLGDSRKLYLRSEKRTSPSLAVQVKNHTFYADTSTEQHGALRIEYNGKTLSVYNMDADD